MKIEAANLETLQAPLTGDAAKKEWESLAAGADAPVVEQPGAQKTDDKGDKGTPKPAAAAPAAAPAAAAAATPAEPSIKDVLKAVEDVSKRVRGVEGHVGTLNEGLGKVRTEVSAFQVAAKAAPAGAPAPSAAEIQAAAKSPEKWAKLKTEFPEIAEATEAYVASVSGDVDSRIKAALDAAQKAAPAVDLGPVNKQIGELRTALSEKDMTIAELTVEVHHKGWQATVASPEFTAWMEKAPPEVRALAESDKPSDAVRMLDLYGEAKKAADEAARLQASRDRRLERHGGQFQGREVRGEPKGEHSARDIWNEEARKLDEERARHQVR